MNSLQNPDGRGGKWICRLRFWQSLEHFTRAAVGNLLCALRGGSLVPPTQAGAASAAKLRAGQLKGWDIPHQHPAGTGIFSSDIQQPPKTLSGEVGVISILQSLPVLSHTAAAQLHYCSLLSDRATAKFGLEILLLDDLKAEICALVAAPSEEELCTHRCMEL